MSSTNKTPNYNLPQFLGTDVPAWLGDVNPAYAAIDTGMNDNKNTAQTAINNAASASNAASAADARAEKAQSTADGAVKQIAQMVENYTFKPCVLTKTTNILNLTAGMFYNINLCNVKFNAELVYAPNWSTIPIENNYMFLELFATPVNCMSLPVKTVSLYNSIWLGSGFYKYMNTSDTLIVTQASSYAIWDGNVTHVYILLSKDTQDQYKPTYNPYLSINVAVTNTNILIPPAFVMQMKAPY